MSQFSFDFFSEKTDAFRREDFLLLTENAEVVSYVRKMFDQEEYTAATLPALIIKGERGSGKTHLLHVIPGMRSSSSAMTQTKAELAKAELELRVPGEFLTEEKIVGVNLLNFLQPNQFYFFENIDEISSEELLLSLVNSATEKKAFLILTTKAAPKFQLKDLVSRLRNITTVEIKNPSQESVKQLVVNQLARRQVKSSATMVTKICRDAAGSYARVVDLVKMLG